MGKYIADSERQHLTSFFIRKGVTQKVYDMEITITPDEFIKYLLLLWKYLTLGSFTHLETHKEFKNGCFLLKRTKKPFSRLPVDLTLQQTINGDVVAQRIWISAITNSVSARQRWTESHYIRLSVISHLFEELNMTKKEDVSRDLKPNKIKKYGEHLETLILTITETMYPLSLGLNLGQVRQLVKKQLHFFFMSLILEIELVKNLSKNIKATQEGFKKG